MDKMTFSKNQIDMIRVAVQLRREAAMENDEIVEQRKWESILIKLNIIDTFSKENN